jgi:DNA-binding beta-propeller fold protein YncE
MRLRLLASASLGLIAAAALSAAPQHKHRDGRFEPIASFAVEGAADGSVAEIVAATPNGKLLVYTDSVGERIGFVDVQDPDSPVQLGVLDMGGEPTSVAITRHGRYALVAVSGPDDLAVVKLSTHEILRRIPLFGQPDCVAVSPDGFYAAIAIENERDEDVNDGEMPQAPPGFLTIVDLLGSPDHWQAREVSLAGIADRFSSDPETEFVDIRSDNVAAVTLQENNHVVLVQLATGEIVGDFPAGTTTHAADLDNDDVIEFTDTLTNARREPDGIVWTPGGRLATANEGDYDLDLADGEFVGGRNFTIFGSNGAVLFDEDSSLEEAAADEGFYDDGRSDNAGCEFEGVAIGLYARKPYLFVGSERCAFVGVYDIADEENPALLQLLPTGDRPEGLLAIPRRDLFVTANEGDGTLSIFRFERD